MSFCFRATRYNVRIGTLLHISRDIISVALVHLLKTTEAKKINVLIKIIKGPEGNPVN